MIRDLVDAVVGHFRDHDARARGRGQIDVVDADAEARNDSTARHLLNHVRGDLRVGHEQRVGRGRRSHDGVWRRFVGRPQLAALGIAATLLSAVFAIFNFLQYGTTAQVARAGGAGESAAARRLGAQAVWLSIGFGVAGVFGTLWFAAKVFRVGILMFGKAPNMRTLIAWVRAA